jgi:hypothetical protein
MSDSVAALLPDTLRAARRGPLILGAALALLGLSLLPLLLVEVPPLDDYVNHLARMHVIAKGGDDPFLARFYEVEWRVIPNLAMDIIVPWLARLVGIFAAGKLFVAAYVALIAGGVFAVHYAVHRRPSPAPLLAFFFVYNQVHFFGVANYLFGVGVALWGLAAWIALRDGPALRRGAVSLLFVLALFAAHLFALGLYGLALLAVELDRWRRGGRPDAAALLAFAAPFVVVPLLMLLSPTAGFATAARWYWRTKLDGFWVALRIYHPAFDLATGVVLALAGAVAWRSGGLRLAGAGRLFLLLALPVYLVMPAVLFGSWGADLRLPLGVAFVAIRFLDEPLPLRRAAEPALAVVVGRVALRVAEVAVVWRGLGRDFAALGEALSPIAPGSTVLVADGGAPQGEGHALTFAPSLAVIERSSFVPYLFTHPGKQPLAVRPAYRDIADPEGELPPPLSNVLAAARDPRLARGPDPFWLPGGAPRPTPYWSHWPERFDYLFVLFPQDARNPAPDLLVPLRVDPRFQLYEVRRPR